MESLQKEPCNALTESIGELPELVQVQGEEEGYRKGKRRSLAMQQIPLENFQNLYRYKGKRRSLALQQIPSESLQDMYRYREEEGVVSQC